MRRRKTWYRVCTRLGYFVCVIYIYIDIYIRVHGCGVWVCASPDIGAIYYVAAAAYGMSCFIGAVSSTAAAGYGMPCVNGWDWLHLLSGLMHC